MKDQKTILFPTDFSPRASKALDQAIDFAKKFNYKMLVYHVYHRPINTEGTSTTLLRQIEGKAEKNLHDLEKNFLYLWRLLFFLEKKKINHPFDKQ